MLRKNCCGTLLNLCDVLLCPNKVDSLNTTVIATVAGAFTAVFEHYSTYYQIQLGTLNIGATITIPTIYNFDVNYCYKVYLFVDGVQHLDIAGNSGVQFCAKLLSDC